MTYALFGIDPADFYATRFASGKLDPRKFNPIVWPSDYRFSYLCEEFQRLLPPGRMKLLDIGCGSGRFGGYLKSRLPHLEITGLEISEASREDCEYHGYDHFIVTADPRKIPFPDNSFDGVFSVDVFGHVEFRDKDGLIAETSRVLKPGGVSVHGVETADIDYLSCADPANPNDPIRVYVWIDGHIGVETPAETIARFSRYFRVERSIPMVFPFHDIDMLVNNDVLGAEFNATYAGFSTPERDRIANTVIRGMFDYLLKRRHAGTGSAASPELFFGDKGGNEFILPHGGFTIISMTKTRPVAVARTRLHGYVTV